MQAATILVVEDDPGTRRLFSRFLTREGFEVLEAASGRSLFEQLDRHSVDLVTLDLKLGGEDGLALAREIRQRHDVGLIMISGRGEWIDRVIGLEVGADDYLAKPVELRELLARVHSVLRRLHHSAERSDVPITASYRFAGARFDPLRRELRRAGDNQASVELTGAEYELLQVLVDHPYQVLSRDRLMDLLKGQNWCPTDRSIDNRILRLRRKLRDVCGTDPVQTVRGAGYRLVAEVQRD